MCWRFFQSLQEGIEGLSRKHMHLVDDKHLVFSCLRWYMRLLHQIFDLLYTIVGGSIQFEDVQRTSFCKCLTAFALSTGISCSSWCKTVYHLCKDAGTGSLSYSARSAEQVCMSQFPATHSILQRCGQRTLSHHAIECQRTIFSC